MEKASKADVAADILGDLHRAAASLKFEQASADDPSAKQKSVIAKDPHTSPVHTPIDKGEVARGTSITEWQRHDDQPARIVKEATTTEGSGPPCGRTMDVAASPSDSEVPANFGAIVDNTSACVHSGISIRHTAPARENTNPSVPGLSGNVAGFSNGLGVAGQKKAGGQKSAGCSIASASGPIATRRRDEKPDERMSKKERTRLAVARFMHRLREEYAEIEQRIAHLEVENAQLTSSIVDFGRHSDYAHLSTVNSETPTVELEAESRASDVPPVPGHATKSLPRLSDRPQPYDVSQKAGRASDHAIKKSIKTMRVRVAGLEAKHAALKEVYDALVCGGRPQQPHFAITTAASYSSSLQARDSMVKASKTDVAADILADYRNAAASLKAHEDTTADPSMNQQSAVAPDPHASSTQTAAENDEATCVSKITKWLRHSEGIVEARENAPTCFSGGIAIGQTAPGNEDSSPSVPGPPGIIAGVSDDHALVDPKTTDGHKDAFCSVASASVPTPTRRSVEPDHTTDDKERKKEHSRSRTAKRRQRLRAEYAETEQRITLLEAENAQFKSAIENFEKYGDYMYLRPERRDMSSAGPKAKANSNAASPDPGQSSRSPHRLSDRPQPYDVSQKTGRPSNRAIENGIKTMRSRVAELETEHASLKEVYDALVCGSRPQQPHFAITTAASYSSPCVGTSSSASEPPSAVTEEMHGRREHNEPGNVNDDTPFSTILESVRGCIDDSDGCSTTDFASDSAFLAHYLPHAPTAAAEFTGDLDAVDDLIRFIDPSDPFVDHRTADKAASALTPRLPVEDPVEENAVMLQEVVGAVGEDVTDAAAVAGRSTSSQRPRNQAKLSGRAMKDERNARAERMQRSREVFPGLKERLSDLEVSNAWYKDGIAQLKRELDHLNVIFGQPPSEHRAFAPEIAASAVPGSSAVSTPQAEASVTAHDPGHARIGRSSDRLIEKDTHAMQARLCVLQAEQKTLQATYDALASATRPLKTRFMREKNHFFKL